MRSTSSSRGPRCPAPVTATARARGIDPMPPVDGEKYPNLAKAIADNPFDDEQLFVESLRLFLVGVRQRVASGTIGRPLD